MNDRALDNVNVSSESPILTPDALKALVPLSLSARHTVLAARENVRRILDRADPRLLIICGPCSIHDPKAAIDYAQRLKRLAAEVSDTLFLIMRVYFEKPRTTTGWKGLINDPHLDAAQLSRHRRTRPLRDHPDPRQPLRARRAARWREAELRLSVGGAHRAGAARARSRRQHHDRLQPRQLQ